MAGIRNINCRDNDRMMAMPALLMNWKKLAVVIWKPIRGIKAKVMRIPRSVISISSSLSVKALTSCEVNNSPKMNPETTIIEATCMVSFNVCFTRPRFSAP